MGKACCGLNFLKNFLNTFNIIFLLVGSCIIGVVVWVCYNCCSYFPLLPSSVLWFTVAFLFTAGCLSVISSLMGCYAALKENRICLLVYIFTLVLIALLELIVGGMSYIYLENVEAELKMNMNETMIMSYNDYSDRTKATDYVQQKFRCCGVGGFRDWEINRYWKDNIWLKENKTITNIVPDSCCKSMSTGCGRRDHPSNINYTGCLDPLAEHIKKYLVILCAVGTGLSLIQIFGIIFGMKLYFELRKDVGGSEGDMFLKNQN